jgi:hypothetical protein
MSRITGKDRESAVKTVVRMRDIDQVSWRTIANELEVSPRTTRAMYDSHYGEGAHHGLLPGKGGRHPVAKEEVAPEPKKATRTAKATPKATAPKAAVKKVTAKAPVKATAKAPVKATRRPVAKAA